MTDVKSMTREELTAYLQGIGEKPFRAGQVFSWLHKGARFSEMTSLSLALREKLAETRYICAFGYAPKPQIEDVESALREADRLMYENKASIKKEMLERGETVHYRQ